MIVKLEPSKKYSHPDATRDYKKNSNNALIPEAGSLSDIHKQRTSFMPATYRDAQQASGSFQPKSIKATEKVNVLAKMPPKGIGISLPPQVPQLYTNRKNGEIGKKEQGSGDLDLIQGMMKRDVLS